MQGNSPDEEQDRLRAQLLQIATELDAAENRSDTVDMLEALLKRHGEGHHKLDGVYPCHIQQAIFAIKARDRANDRRADILRGELAELRRRHYELVALLHNVLQQCTTL